MPTVRKNSFKNMEIHSFFDPIPYFAVDVMEDVTKAEFLICFGARNLNEEKGQSFCRQKISQDNFIAIATLSS